jgi:tetratricopeptide (TPR) repeat protein
MWVIQRQLENVGLGHLWGEVDLDGIAAEVERVRTEGDAESIEVRPDESALFLAGALIDNWRGQFERALSAFEVIVDTASRNGDQRSAMRALGVSGMIWRLRGDGDRALRDFEAAVALAISHGTPADEVYLRVLQIAGSDFPDWVAVESELERCRRLLTDVDDDHLRTHVDLAEGWGLAAVGRSEDAIARLEAALPLLPPLERAVNEVRLAEILAADGEVERARVRAMDAHGTFESWRARYWAARAEVLLAELDGDFSARRLRGLLADLPDDVAYVRLIDPTGSLAIELDGPCVARRDGVPLEFLTRHAGAALRLAVAAGPDGITVDDLAAILWPEAEPDRVGQRVRTMLWQVRSTLGTDAWRLQRRRNTVTFSTVGCDVTGTVDRSAIAEQFAQ